MNVGDHIPDIFLGYLLDGEGENSPTSHLEETGGFINRVSKEDVIDRAKHAGRSWKNLSFLY